MLFSGVFRVSMMAEKYQYFRKIILVISILLLVISLEACILPWAE